MRGRPRPRPVLGLHGADLSASSCSQSARGVDTTHGRAVHFVSSHSGSEQSFTLDSALFQPHTGEPDMGHALL